MKIESLPQVEVIETTGNDYRGKPYKIPSFRFWDRRGTQHTGDVMFRDVIKAMGLTVKPGDILRVTVEVNIAPDLSP